MLKKWVLAAIIFGFGAAVSYTVSVLISLPVLAAYLVFMTFGPLFCLTTFSLYQYLKNDIESFTLKLGTMLLVIGGGVVTIMAAMQGALRIYMNELPQAASLDEATKTSWKMALHAGNSLQLGVDVAWDFFVLSGLILLGVAMNCHPRFGKWFGWTAIVVGVAGLVLNSWTFPEPPGSSGLIDIGPLVGIWFTIVAIQLIRIYRKLA